MPRPRILLLPLLLLAAACKEGPLDVVAPPTTTVLSESGLEQVLQLEAEHPWKDLRGGFRISSRLVNRGTEPVTVRVTACYLEYGVDVKSKPKIELLAFMIPGCVAMNNVITLQPGQSSGSMSFGGQVQDPGRYKVSIRHAQDPELWGEIELVVR
jgi:hypothetical protein